MPERMRHQMFRWMGPFGLLLTGGRASVATIFARYADKRDLQRAYPEAPPFPAGRVGEAWVDFVADVGDGFDSTFSVASLLARPELQLPSEGGAIETVRGDVLVIGGDLVYPTPDEDSYRERFVEPYRNALPEIPAARPPSMFAIPGNHDWYDGLTSFLRLMCNGQSIGGWATRQTRSYFAISLPHRWWLLGIDIQLDSSIDQPQLSYFSRLASAWMLPGDRVILVTGRPTWVLPGLTGDEAYKLSERARRNLYDFEQHVIREHGGEVRVTLSGDLHHYARYESADASVQRITAGGGGAFLYPTHVLDPQIRWRDGPANTPTTPYPLKSRYPDCRTSRRLRIGALNVLRNNPSFALVTGPLYVAELLIVRYAITRPSQVLGGPELDWPSTIITIVKNPMGFLILALLFGGLYTFADASRWYERLVIGIMHFAAHLAAIGLVVWAASMLLSKASILGASAIWPGTFVAGSVLGSYVMGLYLLVMHVVFRRHPNEVFASQHIEDHKCFLRMRIGADGSLRIFPIAIDRVTRRWVENPAPHGPLLVPAGGDVIARLIEDPIDVA